MKKKWLWGAAALAVAAGAGVAVMSGVVQRPGALAQAKSADAASGQSAKAGKDGKKPELPLEFVPREVVQPTLARLPGVVEFSGCLLYTSRCV